MATYGLTNAGMDAEIESMMTAENIAAGKDWFVNEKIRNQELAEKYDVSLPQSTAVMSALSPMKGVPENRQLQERCLKMRKEQPSLSDKEIGARMGGGLYDNATLASSLTRPGANMDSLGGPKRRSFYNNMLHPGETNDVTVDRWMGQVAVRSSTNGMGGAKDSAKAAGSFTKAQSTVTGGGAGYVSISDSVRRVAVLHNMSPDQVQATYWTAVAGGSSGRYVKGAKAIAQ